MEIDAAITTCIAGPEAECQKAKGPSAQHAGGNGGVFERELVLSDGRRNRAL